MKDYLNLNEEKMKEAIKIRRDYATGKIDLDLARAMMKAHVGELNAAEIAYIEQEVDEKLSDGDIKKGIDKLVDIYNDTIVDKKIELLSGHPIRNYMEENSVIRGIISEIDELFANSIVNEIFLDKFNKLNEYKKHLSRKQNQLYAYLERKGFNRPTTIMWLLDNEVRDRISLLLDLASKEFTKEDLKNKFEEFKEYVFDLMEKEETILYPTSLDILTDSEFLQMISGDEEIGYCLIEPGDDYMMNNKEDKKNKEEDKQESGFYNDFLELLSRHNIDSKWNSETKMDVSQGILSLNQINLIFKHLPVDISYVDENDIVAFYSDTENRVFPRSKGVIGRNVKSCHPSNSVKIVEEIIEKFRSGEEDRVDFWINKPDMFIYILYTAVRDEEGNFKGVLEMMQDCTRIRKLEGTMSLLNWGDKSNKKTDDSITGGNEKVVRTREERITILKEDTKLSDLMEDYPGLKDYMISRSDKFSIMKGPMFKMIVKKADVGMISERTGFSIELLQSEFSKYIDSL